MPSAYELSDISVQYKQDDLTGSGNGTLASHGDSSLAKPSGMFISTAKGFILAFLAIAIAVGVGIIVHFAGSDRNFECTCTLPEAGGIAAALEECKQLASSGNLDICSACPKPTTATCPPATTASPPDMTSPEATTTTTTAAATTTTNTTTTMMTTTTEAPPAVDVRLPDTLVPLLYTIELQPDFYPPLNLSEFTFNGSVKILIECRNNTSTITLHSYMINITGLIHVTEENDMNETDLYHSHNESDAVLQFLTVHTRVEMVAGRNYTLHITQFVGPLRNDFYGGLFVDSYMHGNETVYFAASDMQPINARKAFPCFDEPTMKAQFDVTLVRKADMNMTSLSNMPKIGNPEERGDGWMADRFERTPMMPTYLVAFAVTDFGSKTGYAANNVTFRTWARREVVEEETEYALGIGIAMQDEFARYFKVNYSLPKQDMITIPNFPWGGMENWGLITYREVYMLFKEGESTTSLKRYIAYLVAHEIAHMWFGNLVTLAWWNELWLNEGFASYLEYVATDHAHPDWNIWDRFGYDITHGAFRYDGQVSSHPMSYEANTPNEVNSIFTTVAYSKGASIIRMMRFMVGDDAFQAALTEYLSTHEYGSVVQDDLWTAFSNHTSIDVKAVMDTWTLQMNYPVVMVTFNTSGQMSLSQSRYLSEPSKADPGKYPSPYNYTWSIPIAYTTSDDPRFNVTSDDVTMMNTTTLDISNSSIPIPDGAAWILVNPMQYGYYRVNYDDTNWGALIQQLNMDHTVIHTTSRAQLINDAWSLASSGNLSMLKALGTTEYLDQERDLVPWETASLELQTVRNMLQRHPLYLPFTRFMLNKTMTAFSEMTLNNTNATYTEAVTRQLISSLACYYGNTECVEEAMTMYRLWRSDPDMHTVDPDVKVTVYCTAVANGGLEAWEHFMARYRATGTYAEKTRLLNALTCAREAWLLTQLLEMSLVPAEIPEDSAESVITAVSRNANGRDIAWSFFVTNFDKMNGYLSRTSMSRIITRITESFNTQFDVDKLKAFMDEKGFGTSGGSFAQALENAENNVIWMEKNAPVIQNWLSGQGF